MECRYVYMEILVLVGDAIPPAPAVPSSTGISARLEACLGHSSLLNTDATADVALAASRSGHDGLWDVRVRSLEELEAHFSATHGDANGARLPSIDFPARLIVGASMDPARIERLRESVEVPCPHACARESEAHSVVCGTSGSSWLFDAVPCDGVRRWRLLAILCAHANCRHPAGLVCSRTCRRRVRKTRQHARAWIPEVIHHMAPRRGIPRGPRPQRQSQTPVRWW